MFTAICRDARRLADGNIETKWEIVEDATAKTVRFETLAGPDNQTIKDLVKTTLRTLVASTDDVNLKTALIGKTITV